MVPDLQRRRCRWMRACLAAVLVLSSLSAAGQNLTEGLDPAIRFEIEYAEMLNRVGLPDFAQKVLGDIRAPEASYWVDRIRLEAMVSKGQWDAVKAEIAKQPDQDGLKAWAMRLTLADGYYAWGEYPKAEAIYNNFLKKYPQGPPPALKDFYIESVYKFTQMLMLLEKDKQALSVYKTLSELKDLPEPIRRQVKTEMAELSIQLAEDASPAERTAHFKLVEEVCNDILWKQDLWFGKAIVILAHMNMIKGDLDAATELVDDYWGQLKQLDETLREESKIHDEELTRLSPMAQVRYLLGKMMYDEAQKQIKASGARDQIVALLVGTKKPDGSRRAGALQHFYNVFIGYPGTPWAPDAGIKVQEIEKLLTAPPYNARIQVEVTPEQLAEVERYQFQHARTKYSQNQFGEAVDSYLTALNLFPEGPSAVAALGELTRCYIEEEDHLYALTVLRYLGERFSENADLATKAGDQVLRAAILYGERQWDEQKKAAYDVFFDHFPEHPSAPATLMRFGEQRLEKEDFEGAIEYFTRLREKHRGSPLWFNAMNRLAHCYARLEKPVQEIKTLQAWIEGLQEEPNPGQQLINAMYREAVAYKRLGPKFLVAAFNRFFKLDRLLSGPERKKYEGNPAQKERNDAVLQGALYNKAACYAQMDPPQDKPSYYRKLQAIKTLEELVEQFPKSDFAPSALSQIGTIWTILGKTDRAGKALQRLQKEYPDTPEAQNALFMLGMNLLKMDRKTQAVKVFKDMFTGASGDYSEKQILTAGNELLAAEEYDIALEAFERVLATAQERAIREPALLGRGRILTVNGRFEEAAKVLEQMLEDYPRSGFTVEASLYLSEAYSELGKAETDAEKRREIFNQAIAAMNRARKFEKELAGVARLDLELGRIAARKAAAEDRAGNVAKAREYRDEAISYYQKLILFGNRGDPGVKKHIETAYAECLPLLLETERYEDVLTDANAYIEEYPDGEHGREVRSLRGRARVKLAATATVPTDGRPPEAGDEEAGAGGPAAPEEPVEE